MMEMAIINKLLFFVYISFIEKTILNNSSYSWFSSLFVWRGLSTTYGYRQFFLTTEPWYFRKMSVEY